jgi:hypothetical protein
MDINYLNKKKPVARITFLNHLGVPPIESGFQFNPSCWYYLITNSTTVFFNG